MNKYLSILIVLFGCNAAAAEDVYQYQFINLLENLHKVENAHIVNEGPIQYWESINPANNSEIIYKISLLQPMLWSNWKSNSELLYDSKREYLNLSISSDSITYKSIDFATFPKAFQNFTRDTSYGSAHQNTIFLKAEWQGEFVKTFISNSITFGYPTFRAAVIPEPASGLIALIAILMGLTFRKKKSMTAFITASDDQHSMWLNFDSIAMFRIKKNPDGSNPLARDSEVEVTLITGNVLNLLPPTSEHFLEAIAQLKD